MLGFFDPTVFGVALGHVMAVFTPDFVVAAGPDGGDIADTLRDLIQPIVLLVMGVVAVTFLFKRQLTQFFQFAVLGVLVWLFLSGNVEGLLKSLGTWLKGIIS